MSVLGGFFHDVYKISPQQLDVTLAARTEHQFNDPKTFKIAWNDFFGSPPKFDLQESPNYTRKNLFYSSNVCYYETTEFTTSGVRYKKPVKNKFSLCPFCEPFQTVLESNDDYDRLTHNPYDGVMFPAYMKVFPTFYDTLHKTYSQHMRDVHGYWNTGIKTQQPFVGLCFSQCVYNVVCICPYSQCNQPCLAVIEFDWASSNPYKQYFNHVRYHHITGGKEKPGHCFNGQTTLTQDNFFYPLSEDKFAESLLILQNECGDPNLNPFKICLDKDILNKIRSIFIESNDQWIAVPISHKIEISKLLNFEYKPIEESIDGILAEMDNEMNNEFEKIQGRTLAGNYAPRPNMMGPIAPHKTPNITLNQKASLQADLPGRFEAVLYRDSESQSPLMAPYPCTQIIESDANGEKTEEQNDSDANDSNSNSSSEPHYILRSEYLVPSPWLNHYHITNQSQLSALYNPPIPDFRKHISSLVMTSDELMMEIEKSPIDFESLGVDLKREAKANDFEVWKLLDDLERQISSSQDQIPRYMPSWGESINHHGE